MSLTQAQLATHVAKVLERDVGQQAVAYAWPYPWAGGANLEVDGTTLPVRCCRSPLALREALDAGDGATQVLLVDIAENRLGQDVLARMFHHRLLHIDRWQLVCDAVGVKQVDPRLSALPWMADQLIDALPADYVNTSPVLTRDQALALYLNHILGLAPECSAMDDLALACEQHGALWAELEPAQQQVLGDYLVARFGALAAAFAALMAAGNQHAIVATGLVCDVLYAEQGHKDPALRDARVRLEARIGGYQPSDIRGRQWASLALSVFRKRADTERHRDERLAMDLLEGCGASGHVHFSRALSAGLDARFDVLGTAIERFLRAPASLPLVADAAQRVEEHIASPKSHPGQETARMALRLCRSLAADTDADATASTYRRHGVWQDMARRSLRDVRPAGFAKAVRKLLDRIGEQRRSADQSFATRLADSLHMGEIPHDLTPIESALDRLVVPLAQDNPVLMVVLDGMSMDVAYALQASLTVRGWQSWSPARHPAPTLLATVPSVTECSRASLFAGRVAKGPASKEKQWFAAHEGLRKVCHADAPPRLFHKAGMEQGHQLNPDVAATLANERQRVVGVVINAIDDALAKSEQIRIDWSLQSIPLLDALLEHARRSERVVILTSDHGHILDRDTTYTPGGAGERYRMPDRAPVDGELQVSGPRVNALMGSDLIVPWREDLRYAPRKNGYHGGISRQEMLVPFSIWTAHRAPSPDGAYEPTTHVPPTWWDEPMVVADPAAAAPRACKVTKTAEAAVGDLFTVDARDSVVDKLLASAQLAHQNERIGRVALPADRLGALLRRLERGSGRASIEQLAQAASVRVMRMRGVISVLERTLNVDGFPVITFEQDTGTVLLDVALLRTQFQL